MAVYTHLGEAELRAHLAGYDLGELRAFAGIEEGVENSNFRLETACGRFILTLYEKRVEPADLPFFLGLMEHLARAGLPCPLPIHDRAGVTLRELHGRPAAIITYLAGAWPRQVEVAHCGALGAALAELHLAGQDFALTRPNALALPGWHRLFEACRGKADAVAPGLEAEITAELDELAASWPSGLPAGVIHADLFPDNVFFTDGRVSGLLDFYFACNDLLAYDLAICLNAWCFTADHAFSTERARALVDGYCSRRVLAPDEMAALPVLARGAALRFLMTRLYDWLHRVDGALVQPKDPREYMAKLRFHRGLKGAAAYGLG